MSKKIELLLATDPKSLKEKLEEMINSDWEIRGFVSFNSGNPYADSYAVLERHSDKSIVPELLTVDENQEPLVPAPSDTSKKDITISMGDGH